MKEYMAVVEELILSKEIQSGTHNNKREMTNLNDIPQVFCG